MVQNAGVLKSYGIGDEKDKWFPIKGYSWQTLDKNRVRQARGTTEAYIWGRSHIT